MTLELKENEVCPYFQRCPHNNNIETCLGANSFRATPFTCSYVDDRGNISESGFRNPLDQTGKQVILQE